MTVWVATTLRPTRAEEWHIAVRVLPVWICAPDPRPMRATNASSLWVSDPRPLLHTLAVAPRHESRSHRHARGATRRPRLSTLGPEVHVSANTALPTRCAITRLCRSRRLLRGRFDSCYDVFPFRAHRAPKAFARGPRVQPKRHASVLLQHTALAITSTPEAGECHPRPQHSTLCRSIHDSSDCS